MFAYKHWKYMCCDCTCVDTFTFTNANESVVKAGSAINAAETNKRAKNQSLTDRYQIEAEIIETGATYSDKTNDKVHDIGRRTIEVIGIQRKFINLM